MCVRGRHDIHQRESELQDPQCSGVESVADGEHRAAGLHVLQLVVPELAHGHRPGHRSVYGGSGLANVLRGELHVAKSDE